METNGSTADNVNQTEVNPSPLLDTCTKRVGNNPTRFFHPSVETSTKKKDLCHYINQDNQISMQVSNKLQSIIHSNKPEGQKEIAHDHIFLDMNKTEEVTTLLDDDEDEFASDTSDDLHKVTKLELNIYYF